MKTVIGVRLEELTRFLGVTHHFVEVKDAIYLLVGTYPIIQGETGRLAEMRVVAIPQEGSDGAQINLLAGCLGLGDELGVGLREFTYRLGMVGTHAADVVDTLEDDHRGDARLLQDVAFETLHGRFA